MARSSGVASSGREVPHAIRPRRSAVLGALAGVIGIGCCVYPVVLVLLGLSSAAAAIDLGNALFDGWGWAFRSVGATTALAALWLQRRRARSCPVDERPSLARNALWIAGVAVGTYVVLYALTSSLATLAS